MANFKYKALNEQGRMVQGQLVAANEWDLESRLSQANMILVTFREAAHRQFSFSSKKALRRELINFCFHLEQAHSAGVPLLAALKDLRDSTTDPGFQSIVAALILSIENGKCLSEAMEEFPGTFDEVFISLIDAGEKSGELASVLQKMIETMKWQDELIAQTKKLLTYPAFVGTVLAGVIFFLMMYVVPQMMDFLATMGQEVPLHTRALIFTSNLFLQYWYLIISIPVGSIIALRIALRKSVRVRYHIDGFKLRAWLIGPILQKIIMSRFATYFAIMYSSGITILDALHTSRKLAGNAVVSDALARASQEVANGQSLSSSIESVSLFPQLVIRMIRMGEESGQLDKALANVTYFYNREVQESVDHLQSMIEPVMTVTLGLLLGWIMMSVLGPIYDTIGSIGV